MVPHQKNELETHLVVSAPSAGVSNVCEVKHFYKCHLAIRIQACLGLPV